MKGSWAGPRFVAAVVAVLVGCSVITLPARPAHACSCGDVTPRSTFEASDLVAIGKATPAPSSEPNEHAWDVTLEKVVKGSAEHSVRIVAFDGPCGTQLLRAQGQEAFAAKRTERGYTLQPCAIEMTVPLVNALTGTYPPTAGAGAPAIAAAGMFGDRSVAILDREGRPRSFVQTDLSMPRLSACPGGRVLAALGYGTDATATGPNVALDRIDISTGRVLGRSQLNYPSSAGFACADPDGRRVAVVEAAPTASDPSAFVVTVGGEGQPITQEFNGVHEDLRWDAQNQRALVAMSDSSGTRVRAVPGGRLVRELPAWTKAIAIAPTLERAAIAGREGDSPGTTTAPTFSLGMVDEVVVTTFAEGTPDVVVPVEPMTGVRLYWIDEHHVVAHGYVNNHVTIKVIDVARAAVENWPTAALEADKDRVVSVAGGLVSIDVDDTGWTRLEHEPIRGAEASVPLEGFAVRQLVLLPAPPPPQTSDEQTVEAAAPTPTAQSSTPPVTYGAAVAALVVFLVSIVLFGRRFGRKSVNAHQWPTDPD